MKLEIVSKGPEQTMAIAEKFASTLKYPCVISLRGELGAGKTTLIRLICGLQEPTSGDYTLYGIKNTEKTILKSRRRMGAVVENPSIYMALTAVDNRTEKYRIF